MRQPNFDPTAGETARAVNLDPAADPRVTDPMSPSYGRRSSRVRELGGHVGRVIDPTEAADPVVGGHVGHVVDPTDPACAKRSD